ncbi:MAG: efflux RND transporter permease subunit [Myxococcaceae bacterium]|nr:efflux RND transporter permease subunit [Myxococcaceae bacterium]
MTLSDVSIKRPVFTTMLALLLVVLGLFGLRSLGTDLFPNVSFPVVVTTVVYPGAGPAEVESQVIKPLEDAIAGISGVDFIHSWSRESYAVVVTQFKLSQSLDRAVQDVRDKVAATANNLPKDAKTPVVGKIDIGAAPIQTYAVSASMPSPQLRQLIEDRVKPALAQLEGVAEVRVLGGDTREVRVDVSVDKALAAGIAPALVAQQLGLENLDVPAGHLEVGPKEIPVRALGQFPNVDAIRSLPVARSQSGSQVLLSEVAEVTDGVAERRTVARLNGKDAVLLDVVKAPGSNTIEVAKNAKRVLDGLGAQLGHDFKATLLIDQAKIIQANAHEVWIALFFGGAMAILIILMFLLDARGTFISSLALPTSVVGTFFVMSIFSYSLNQMTLLALSLAIGLLIDDAVVVREAITHRLEEGESPMEAASKGTKDVGLAVLATTLSLVAVFVPVAFMPGMVGQFFKEFGVTISAAVIISLFISFTLDPMLSARLAKRRVPGQVVKDNPVAAVFRAFFAANERGYARVLHWVMKHQALTGLITLGVIVGSVMGARGLGAEFIAAQDRSQLLVDLQLPEGSSVTQTGVVALQAENALHGIPEVTDAYSIIGSNGDANKARLRVLLTPKEKRAKNILKVKEDFRSALAALPDTKVAIIDPPDIDGAGDFFPVMVRILGPQTEVALAEAKRVEKMLKDIKGTADVRVDYSPPRQELQARIDRSRAGDGDLSAGALGMQLRLALNGQEVGKLREDQTETPIVVRLAEADRGDPEAVKRMLIFGPKGPRPLEDVAQVERHDGPSIIERHNRQRQVAVYANLDGAALGDVATQLKAHLKANPVAEGYSVVFDGQLKLLDEQNDAFAVAFGLAFVFVYMVLASQFESFKHPFTIMVSVPLALIGALLSLVLTGYNLSLGAMIGVILLMGLVTKNAILLVDGALQNLRAGDDLETAILKAGPRRLRPILMTSAAMAVGMIPTAIGKGLGAEFRAPMAIVVIGGVITSTFLTLLVVPVVFSVFERLTPKSLRIRAEQPEASMSAEVAK